MTRIFVGGLGDNMAKDDLEREFGKYGRLNQVWVAQNPPGFAFLEFDDDRDADEAIRNMNGVVLNGTMAPAPARGTVADLPWEHRAATIEALTQSTLGRPGSTRNFYYFALAVPSFLCR
ncbi:hypothetical protein MTO96_014726 [Rhipicephalus appendiculatus]